MQKCYTIHTSETNVLLYIFVFFISILKMYVKAQNATRMPPAKATSVRVNLVSKETE